MKLIRGDFQQIQISLFACLIMVAIATVGIILARSMAQSANQGLSAARAQHNSIDGKLKRVRSEEIEIKEKSALFNRLQARGIIGDEQRLEWVELLKEIRDKRRLPDLRYEIEPQRALDTLPGKNFRFSASTMKLQLNLLHEEDLIRLLDDIRQQAKALIQIKYCNVSRQPPSGGNNSGQANLTAECRIDWITLHEISTREGGEKQ